MIKKLFKGGKDRAVTFSFDDGQPQDMRLIKILNKYSLKATFNLNGGRCRNGCFRIKENDRSLWDGSDELRECYAGHEIAAHGYDHIHFNEVGDEESRLEIENDIMALERAFGYKIRGFAAPYGKYGEREKQILRKNGICYNRSTKRNYGYTLPEDFLEWAPNPHFSYYLTEEGKKLIDNFLISEEELACLNIWGHSYEITDLDCHGFEKWNGLRDRWSYFDRQVCAKLANKSDNWYATNIEICDYVCNMRRARVSETYVDNPSEMDLFFRIDGKLITAPAGSRFEF